MKMANTDAFQGDLESLTEFPPLPATLPSTNNLGRDTESISPEAFNAPAAAPSESLGKRVYLDAEDGVYFTDGPTRLVVATDTKKDCTALLITEILSERIQNAVLAQRRHEELEPANLAGDKALDKLINRLNNVLREEWYERAEMEWFDASEDGSGLRRCEERIGELEKRRDEAIARQGSLRRSRQRLAQKSQRAQAAVMFRIETAFVVAGLLPHTVCRKNPNAEVWES